MPGLWPGMSALICDLGLPGAAFLSPSHKEKRPASFRCHPASRTRARAHTQRRSPLASVWVGRGWMEAALAGSFHPLNGRDPGIVRGEVLGRGCERAGVTCWMAHSARQLSRASCTRSVCLKAAAAAASSSPSSLSMMHLEVISLPRHPALGHLGLIVPRLL